VSTRAESDDSAREERDRLAEILKDLKRLPKNELEALVLCVWEGLSSKEAAQALMVSEVTVRTRLARARSRLRSAEGDAREPKEAQS
jgi:RNA polymerase sigma-70 factor (ECF subfamily)